MRISHLLTHRADLQHRATGKNEYGQKNTGFALNPDGTPDLAYTNVACRAYVKSDMEKYSDQLLGVVEDIYHLYFDIGANIGEQDRIYQVRTSSGAVIAQNIDVVGVRRIPGRRGTLHHIEVTAFAYRDGANVNWLDGLIQNAG